jgi:hypothetical protein
MVHQSEWGCQSVLMFLYHLHVILTEIFKYKFQNLLLFSQTHACGFAIFIRVYKCVFSLISQVMGTLDAGAVNNDFEIEQYTLCHFE